MKTFFRIDYPKSKAEMKRWGKEYGLNSIYAGKHWSRRRDDAEYWHMLLRAALLRWKIPKKPTREPVEITIWYNDRLDLDNHAYMRKLIIDGMKGWVIEDDDRRFIKKIIEQWNEDDSIWVEVKAWQNSRKG